MNQQLLSSKQVQQFHDNGVLILPDFYNIEQDILPIQKGIYNIIGLVLNKYKLKITRQDFSSDTFDDGFQTLLHTNRHYAAEVYDAIKQIPAFIRLVAKQQHETICAQLFSSQTVGIAAAGYGIRIDNPLEERFRAAWHQEFLSQLRSMEGVIYWTPLLNIYKELGPVELCLGSHKEGVLPVVTTDPTNPGKSGAYSVRIVDEEKYIAKYKPVAPLTSLGDLIILDWHTLHRSGKNTAQRSRWAMQIRYFNFDNELGKKISWCGSFAAGIDVKTLLPQYIQT